MIRVTRLDGSQIVVNIDLIEWVEKTPDTVLSLVSGERLLVRESPEELIESALEFKRAVRRDPFRCLPSLATGLAGEGS